MNMKKNFKYVAMAAALMMGFASCSKDDNKVVGDDPFLNTPTEFTIKTKVVKASSSRAVSETAVDIPPHVLDMALIFVGKKNASSPLSVLKVEKGDVAALTGAGQKFLGMPLGITDLYIVGNIEKYSNEATDLVTGNKITNLPADFGHLASKEGSTYRKSAASTEWEKLKEYETRTFDDLQAEVKFCLDNYFIEDVKAVNIYGHGEITATQGTTPLELFVRPAISRYEIKGLKIKSGGPAFTTDGIYISNTMRQISFDGTVYPAKLSGQLLNWGWNEPLWNYSLKDLYNPARTNVTDKQKLPIGKIDSENPNSYIWDSNTDPDKGPTNLTYHYKTTYVASEAALTYGPYDPNGDWANWMDNTDTEDLLFTDELKEDKRYSYYVASARQQAFKQIVNPYDENEAHNFVGLECGSWPYGTYDPANEAALTDEAKGSQIARPTWATKGGAIQYGAFPTVCIKVINPNKWKNTGSTVGWLTITKFIDSATKEYLQHPKEGHVYVFKSVIFDENNVKPDPMYPSDKTDVSVTVEVKGWVGVDVEGENIFN